MHQNVITDEFAQFERWKGKKVLEIGCGHGTESINFARHGALLTVIDVSRKGLALSRQQIEEQGLTARFYQGTVEHIDRIVPVEEYDLIYAFGAVHHAPNPHRAIDKITRYMGPQSELRLMLNSRWCLKTGKARNVSPFTHTFSTAEIKKGLLKGLSVRSLRKDHIVPYAWYLRWLPAPVFRLVRQLLGWHTFVVAMKGDSAR